MKKITYLKATAMFAMALLFICAAPKVNAQDVPDVYDAKSLAKKALKEGKVEIIECKMEKITNKDGKKIIKITGTALYKPAKIGKKPLKDMGFGLRAYLYDVNGMKLKKSVGLSEYGENNQPENVKYKTPFPIILERGIGTFDSQEYWDEQFDKADYCVIRGWNTAKQVSSKDAK